MGEVNILQGISAPAGADRIFGSLSADPGAIEKNIYNDHFGVKWRNPDNMLGGRLAVLFFLLERYKENRHPGVWEQMNSGLEELVMHTESKPTYNQSLFHGRLGLASYYLELFRVTQDKTFLQRSVNMARDHFDGRSVQYNIIDNYSLATGFSGILLFALSLYSESPQVWLVRYFEKYARELITRSNTDGRGLFWGGVSNYQKRNAGLFTGGAGIALALCRLGEFIGNDQFFHLAARAFDYEDNYWQPEKGLWVQHKEEVPGTGFFERTLSLGYGSAGMALARLYAAGPMGREEYRARWRSFLSALTRFMDDEGGTMPEMQMGIPSGWAGIGLACVEGYKLTGDGLCADLAVRVEEKIVSRLNRLDEAHKNRLSELSGAGYFLQRLTDMKNGVPGLFFLPAASGCMDTKGIADESVLRSTAQQIGEMFLLKDFNGTAPVLKEKKPAVYFSFLDRNGPALSSDFGNYVRGHVPRSGRMPEMFWDDLERECFILEIKKQLPHYQYQEEIGEVLNMDSLLRLDDREFLSRNLVMSDKIWVFSREQVMDLHASYTTEEFIYYFKNYGYKTFFYRINAVDGFDETVPAGISKIVLDRFISANCPAAACEEVVSFMVRQGPETANLLMVLLNAKDPAELEKTIRRSIINEIRGYFVQGVLMEAITR